MADDFEIVGKITIQDDGTAKIAGLKDGLKGLEGAAGNTGGSFMNLGNVMTVALGGLVQQGISAATGAIMDFGKSTLDEAMQAQTGIAQMDAVLKSTAGAAGMSKDALLGVADSLQKTTAFSDDAVIGGENLMLTFTNVGKDVFPDATKTMLDMSQALGQDVGTSAMQLGKALNDPIQGVTALRRVGVQLTDSQEESVKKMVEMGDTAGAQKVILGELQREFGGSAEAFGKTFPGQMAIFQNSMDQVKEGVGTALLPVLSDLMTNVVMPMMPMIQDAADAFSGWLKSMEDAGTFTAIGKGIFDTITTIVDVVKNLDLSWLINPLISLGTTLFGTIKKIGEALQAGGGASAFKDMLQNTFNVVKFLFGAIMNLITGALQKLGDWFTENQALIGAFITVLSNVWNILLQLIIVVWSAIQPILMGLVDLVLGVVETIMQLFTGDFAGAWETLKSTLMNAVGAIFQGLGNLINGILRMFGTSLPQIGKFFADTWGNIVNGVSGFIGNILTNIGNFVTRFVTAGRNLITGIWTGITGYVSTLITNATNVGSNMLNAIAQGAQNVLASVIQRITNIGQSIINAIKAILGIASPSKVMIDVGLQMMKGWQKGLTDNIDLPVTAMTSAGGSTIAGAYPMPMNTASDAGFRNYGVITINAGQGGDLVTLLRQARRFQVQ